MAIMGEYVLMEDDEVLDELIDHVLVDDLISVWRDGDQRGTKTDSQVVRVHHVLITSESVSVGYILSIITCIQRDG